MDSDKAPTPGDAEKRRKARVSRVETDNVTWWFDEINKVPLLDHSSSTELFKEYVNPETTESRRKRVRDKLITSNLKLVVSIAKHWKKSGLPLEDLIQEGNLGLMRAVEKFDHTKGYRFATYATWWIRQHVSQHVMKRKRTIRLPAHAAGMQKKIFTAAEEFKAETGSEPSSDELAEILNASKKVVNATMASGRQVLSLQSPMGSDEDSGTLEDNIADPGPGPFEISLEKEYLELTRQVLKGLPAKENQILRLRFGIDEELDDSDNYPINEDEMAAIMSKGQGMNDGNK